MFLIYQSTCLLSSLSKYVICTIEVVSLESINISNEICYGTHATENIINVGFTCSKKLRPYTKEFPQSI